MTTYLARMPRSPAINEQDLWFGQMLAAAEVELPQHYRLNAAHGYPQAFLTWAGYEAQQSDENAPVIAQVLEQFNAMRIT